MKILQIQEIELDKITLERWQEAQDAEQKTWNKDTWTEDRDWYDYYRNQAIERYGSILGVSNNDLQHKSILDIGGGCTSMLPYFTNFSYALIVDPLGIDESVMSLYVENNISVQRSRAEDFLDNYSGVLFDEVWIYNVLQHVLEPEKILRKLYKVTRKLRIGEPLEVPTDTHHPYRLTRDWMIDIIKEISIGGYFRETQFDYLYFGGEFDLKVKL